MASTIPNDSDHTPRSTIDSCSSSKYKGVRKRKWGKWVSEIRLPNSRERIWLGSYDSAEKAARAFDAALYCLRGRHANFNFPDTPLELEISVSGDHHQSRSAQEIQELAARFANEYQQEPPMVQQSSEVAAPSSCESDGVTESGDPVEVDNGFGDTRGINDWSFLKSLDETGSANYNGFYSGFDKMHSGELLFPTSPPPFIDHVSDNGDAMECDDAFSQQSLFLWNF
ncbi:ethylene-responsive transcription factor ERF017-like [Neltuma alba]|uniref:ethylene-responsive transcription factor ERF017-like n=1 Tax=Neltuma alba TaxID=207710 RepID=UPI0010A462D2|nr:ethylene-responsive transcription factor ERF017-like [Prosopis alba]